MAVAVLFPVKESVILVRRVVAAGLDIAFKG